MDRAANFIVKEAAERAGVNPAASIHWLRHAHASHAIDNGAPITLVSATLGHADLKTTSVYAHARPGANRRDCTLPPGAASPHYQRASWRPWRCSRGGSSGPIKQWNNASALLFLSHKEKNCLAGMEWPSVGGVWTGEGPALPAPDALPKGGQLAGLSGDAAKSGAFTVGLKMQAGYKMLAHKHPHTERITVISGEFHFGTGDKLDEGRANKLGPGGFVELPANTYHYAFVKGPTVIQISGEGPFGIEYVNPADDPSKKK